MLRKFLRKLKVKELHNLQVAENGTNQKFVESLDDVKDAISEWPDWVKLQAIAEKGLEHPRCGLICELKKGRKRATSEL